MMTNRPRPPADPELRRVWNVVAALAGLVVMGIVVVVCCALLTIQAKNASQDTNSTVSSVVKRFEESAVDPALLAAQARSRQRIQLICEAVGAPCPTEPSTTTTAPRRRDD